jgi:hypothetical protein
MIGVHANHGGLGCTGAKVETESCKPDCVKPPQACKFHDWGAWSECSLSCGGGQKTRARGIASFEQNGGELCVRCDNLE